MSTFYPDIGTLPGGFCPANYQELFNVLSTILSINTGSGSSVTVVISATKPTDTTVVWKRIDSLGRYLGDYIYGQGAWLRAHPLPSYSTIWWFQALPNFTSFDGGDGGTLGIQSGPMWQQAKDVNGNVIAAQFPIAAGTLGSGTVLSNGNTGGEENHLLITSEMPSHTHTIQSYGTSAPSNGHGVIGGANGTTGPYTYNDTTFSTDNLSIAKTGSDTAHNNMPPYIVGYLIQRTTRQFYAVT